MACGPLSFKAEAKEYSMLTSMREGRIIISRFVISIVFLSACAGGVAAQSKYVVRPLANPQFRPSQIFFKFEDISSPPFEELTRRFAFAESVLGVEDEFERILRLRHWIFRTLKVDPSKPNPPMDAISILAQGPTGGPFE